MTPTEQFPLLFFSDHATDKLEILSNTKLRLPSQYTKINSEWIMKLGVKSKPIKHPEKNRETLCDVEFGKHFLAMAPKHNP